MWHYHIKSITLLLHMLMWHSIGANICCMDAAPSVHTHESLNKNKKNVALTCWKLPPALPTPKGSFHILVGSYRNKTLDSLLLSRLGQCQPSNDIGHATALNTRFDQKSELHHCSEKCWIIDLEIFPIAVTTLDALSP